MINESTAREFLTELLSNGKDDNLFNRHEPADFVHVQHGLDVEHVAEKRRAFAQPSAAGEVFKVVDYEIVNYAVA